MRWSGFPFSKKLYSLLCRSFKNSSPLFLRTIPAFLGGFFFASLIFILGSRLSIATTNKFSDVKEGDFFYQSVGRISDKGIINGYKDGTFRPFVKVSRGEMAVIVDLMDKQLNSKMAEMGGEIFSLEERLKELESKTGSTGEAEPQDNNEDITNDNLEGYRVVKRVGVDLASPKDLMDGFQVYEDQVQNFSVQIPKSYFWKNFSDKKSGEGYLWYLSYGPESFENIPDNEIGAKTSLSIAIINSTNKKNNFIFIREKDTHLKVKIYIRIDDTRTFLIEGKEEDLGVLEKIINSLQVK